MYILIISFAFNLKFTSRIWVQVAPCPNYEKNVRLIVWKIWWLLLLFFLCICVCTLVYRSLFLAKCSESSKGRLALQWRSNRRRSPPASCRPWDQRLARLSPTHTWTTRLSRPTFYSSFSRASSTRLFSRQDTTLHWHDSVFCPNQRRQMFEVTNDGSQGCQTSAAQFASFTSESIKLH